MKYPDFITSTHYGDPDGLLGYGCRHGYMPYKEGMKNPYQDEKGRVIYSNRENEKRYELTQKQRYMERVIRKNERRLLVAQTRLEMDKSEVNARKYDAVYERLTMQKAAYKRFCRKNKLGNESL